MSRYLSIPALVALGVVTIAAAAACEGNESGPKTTVTATDDSCQLSATELRAGGNTFVISNKGKQTTEVYVYGRSGDAYTKVIEEKEHIGPGTTANLDAKLDQGTYEIACKPGEKGNGIRTRITVK